MINLKTFYGISSILFIALVGFNIWNFSIIEPTLTIPGKISSLISIIFNGLLTFLFFKMYIDSPKSSLPQEELESLFKKYTK